MKKDTLIHEHRWFESKEAADAFDTRVALGFPKHIRPVGGPEVEPKGRDSHKMYLATSSTIGYLSIPGTGKREARESTSSRTSRSTEASSRLVSVLIINRAICTVSASPIPRLVMAAVPTRIPLATRGGLGS